MALMFTVIIIGALTFDGIYLIVSYAVCGTLTVLGISILIVILLQLFKRKVNRHDEIKKVVKHIEESLKGQHVHLKLNAQANNVSVVWQPKSIAKLTPIIEQPTLNNISHHMKIRLLPQKLIN